MLGLEYKEWQMCHNLKERRTAVVCTRVVWELGIWEWAMGIGSDSGVGMSSRAQTGWQNRTVEVEAEALVAVRSDYVSKAANLVLSLVFEGEETGYDVRLQPHAWVHRHTHTHVFAMRGPFDMEWHTHPRTVPTGSTSQLIWFNLSVQYLLNGILLNENSLYFTSEVRATKV